MMKINREKLLNVFCSDIFGAVIISRDSYESKVHVIPACIGVKTYTGCVEFGAGSDDIPYTEFCDMDEIMFLHEGVCKKIYFDYPPLGTAWLVFPSKKGYNWERIDHLLRFKNEEDWENDNGRQELEDLYLRRYNLREGEFI